MNISTDDFGSAADPGTLSRLRHQLGLAAEAEGLLDVAFTTVDSPVGPLLLAATPKGLVRVAYAVEDHDRVLDTLARQVSPRVLRAPRRLDVAARELDEYFSSQRRVFDLPLDLSLSTGFRQQRATVVVDLGGDGGPVASVHPPLPRVRAHAASRFRSVVLAAVPPA